MGRVLAVILVVSLSGCAPEVIGDRDAGTVTHANRMNPFARADLYCSKFNRFAIIGSYDMDKHLLTFDCIAQYTPLNPN